MLVIKLYSSAMNAKNLLLYIIFLALAGRLEAQPVAGIATDCQFTAGPEDDWDWTVTDPVLYDSDEPVFTDPDYIWYRCNYIVDNQQYEAVKSPFTQANMQSVSDLSIPLPVYKDFKAEDGWVLFRREMGEPHFNVPNSNVSNPFFILYNRYRSILRVFFLITSKEDDYNSSRIHISFDKEAQSSFGNSMLATVDKVMRPLDEMTLNRSATGTDSAPSLSAPCVFDNSLPYWIYGDFPIAYDPCMCLFSSSMIVRCKLIKVAQMEFNFLGSTRTIVNTSNPSSSTGVTETINELTNVLNSANSIYKSSSKAISDFDELNTNLVKSTSRDSSVKNAKELATIADLLKFVPYVGAAANLFDYFVKGGNKQRPLRS